MVIKFLIRVFWIHEFQTSIPIFFMCFLFICFATSFYLTYVFRLIPLFVIRPFQTNS
jgi:hypothetical protein